MQAYGKTRLLICLLLTFVPMGVSAGHPRLDGLDPTVTEVTLLPKFCWGQFLKDKFKGPRFHIPVQTCGVYTNHYCPALISLARANRSLEDRLKRGYLRFAEDGVAYTLRNTRKYPHCPIRAEAMRMYRLIKREQSLFQ